MIQSPAAPINLSGGILKSGWQDLEVGALANALMSELEPGLNLFLLLAMAHFVGDFGLQSDRMALEKCPKARGVLPWGWWMAAHGGIHGFLVAAITGVPLLGLVEWVVHVVIDLGKCQRRYNIAVDQALHLACKLVWVMVIMVTASGLG